MKLSERSELGLRFTDKLKEMILDSHWKRIQPFPTSQQEKESGFNHIKDLFTDKDNRLYLMAKPAMELASGIKIDGDKFDVKILSKIPDKKITFLLGKNLFYRYQKIGTHIYASRVSIKDTPQGDWLDYVLFNMDTDTGYTSGYDDNFFNPYDEHGLRLFVQLVLFTELSELEVKLLKPNTSIGTKREGKYKNESRSNIILVDSTWNKIIVNTTGFAVSGHLRLQMVGKGRKTPDLVYVSPYRKEGYIRRAKKDSSAEYEEVMESAENQ